MKKKTVWTGIWASVALPLSLTFCPLPSLAADATSFDPTRVSIQAQNSIPVGTIIAWHSTGNPADMRNPDGTYNWLECNGQSVSRTAYPELFAAVGSRTPDLRGQFLRGLDAGHSVGETVGDTFRSHAHGQPEHTHTFSGQLASTAISGTAAGQKFSTKADLDVNGKTAAQTIRDNHTGIGGTGDEQMVPVVTWVGGNDAGSVSYSLSKTFMAYQDRTVPSTTVTGSASGTVSGTASSSSVTGRLTNGTVTGTIGSGGGDETYAAGDAETAPRHVYVRYFIRARP